MLKIEDMHVYYGAIHAVKGVSFEVGEGEIVALIGANGAGKSTLMKAALGLITVSGTITIDGLEMNRDNLADIRRRLGYVLQDSDNQMFMPTVFEDMLFGPLNYGMPRPEAEALVDQTLAELNLTHLKNRRNHKLSGGEKRMAAIATILAMQPKIMLMDEPSTALDPKNRRTLIRTLNALPVTKIIATHDLDLVLETCDRVLLLHDGQIAADGPAWEILRDRALLERHSLELPVCRSGQKNREKRRLKPWALSAIIARIPVESEVDVCNEPTAQRCANGGGRRCVLGHFRHDGAVSVYARGHADHVADPDPSEPGGPDFVCLLAGEGPAAAVRPVAAAG